MAKIHSATIKDLQLSKDRKYFITASKDQASMIIDAETLKVLKKYVTDRPVNSAAISPIRAHV